MEGVALSIREPIDAIHAGISYVPEDRQDQGAFLPLGIRENITMASLGGHVRNFLLSPSSERMATRALGGRLSVKAAHWEQALGELSGGNQQKVVIAKWLATKPKIIILDEPTRGIDVGAKAEIEQLIAKLRADGLAVLLISSEIEEIVRNCSRVLVLRERRLEGEIAGAELTPERLMRVMAGGQHD
jgi:ABC-type sugar transport system ATPase subunit